MCSCMWNRDRAPRWENKVAKVGRARGRKLHTDYSLSHCNSASLGLNNSMWHHAYLNCGETSGFSILVRFSTNRTDFAQKPLIASCAHASSASSFWFHHLLFEDIVMIRSYPAHYFEILSRYFDYLSIESYISTCCSLTPKTGVARTEFRYDISFIARCWGFLFWKTLHRVARYLLCVAWSSSTSHLMCECI